MLVATRDPFHDGTHKSSSRRPEPGSSSGNRFMGLLQMTGALLAIPVGLASAYTMYRTNFSAETSCQNLRAGIIATLDKNVEAATRRMLVRRDVQTFEQTCAGFDPDATAAFKSLLAVEKAPAVAAVPRAEPAAKEVTRRPEPRSETVAAKPAAANSAPAAAPPARKDAAASDANWLAAVRGALVDHEPEKPKSAETAVAPVVTAPPPATLNKPSMETTALKHEPAAAPPPVVAAPPPAVAPALPPATSVPIPAPVAAAPVEKVDPERPVPPAPIPGAQPLLLEAKAPGTGRSRLGDLIADIPLLGRVVDPKGN